MTPEAHMAERVEDGLTSDEYSRMAEATQFAIGWIAGATNEGNHHLATKTLNELRRAKVYFSHHACLQKADAE